jgi:membrane-associated phospholipid phosphatase
MNKKRLTIIILFLCSLLSVISYYYWDLSLAIYWKGCKALCCSIIDIAKIVAVFGESKAIYCKDFGCSIIGIAEIVTVFGESQWYFILLILAYLPLRIIWKNKLWSMKLLFIFLSLLASSLISTLIKWLAGRHRPINYFQHSLFGFNYFSLSPESTSFPSGHVVTAFSLAAAVSILFPRAGIAAFIIAISIGLTRIILASHYLSDVIAGAGIGILSTMIVKYFFDQKKIELDNK